LWQEYEAVNARDPIAACYVLLRFFAGLPYDGLVRAAETFWRDGGERLWNEEVIATLRYLKTAGHTVFVVSGSPAVVLQPLLRLLPVDRVLAFELAIDSGGLVTGAHRGIATAGPGKAEAIRASWSHEVAFAIGNSVLDTEMLQLARFAWAYEPSTALLEVARQHGWHLTPRR
jgi:phosphoserine phosphatase